jgi:BolA protein
MNEPSIGPVAREIVARLNAALSPARLDLANQSEQHRGHAGYDGSGESHFALLIESAAFIGQSRVARQRLVYAALGELMDSRIHALSIKALAPGEE